MMDMESMKQSLEKSLKSANAQFNLNKLTLKEMKQLSLCYVDCKEEPKRLLEIAKEEKLQLRVTQVNKLKALQEFRELEEEEKRELGGKSTKKRRKRVKLITKKQRYVANRQKSYKEQYAVEEIEDWQFDQNDRMMMYLVNWEGFDAIDNTWELEFRLEGCTDAICSFLKSRNIRTEEYSFQELTQFHSILRLLVSSSVSADELCLLLKLNEKSEQEMNRNNKNAFSAEMNRMKNKIEYYCNMLKGKVSEKVLHDESLLFRLNNICKFIEEKLGITKSFGSIGGFLQFHKEREQMKTQLKLMEKKINDKIEEMNLAKKKGGKNSTNMPPIKIENNVDHEMFPEFSYITEYQTYYKDRTPQKVGKEVLCSCQCNNCYLEKDGCCSAIVGFPMRYSSKGLLHLSYRGKNLFECNDKCACPSSCPNRVVQNGTKFKLALFKTEKRGWGVKTLESIPRGSFVLEYVGELISMYEAENRPTTYLFDLDNKLRKMDGFVHTYYVDASKRGNIGRFVNHACPNVCNMRVHFVWIESYNELTPHIAFFATRAIKPNEELTYDYGMELVDSINSYDSNEDLEPIAIEEEEESQQEVDSGISSSESSELRTIAYPDAIDEVEEDEDDNVSTIDSENNFHDEVSNVGIKKIPSRRLDGTDTYCSAKKIQCLCDPNCINILYI